MQKLSVFTANSHGVQLSTVTIQSEVTKLTVTEHIILGPEPTLLSGHVYVNNYVCVCIGGCANVHTHA